MKTRLLTILMMLGVLQSAMAFTLTVVSGENGVTTTNWTGVTGDNSVSIDVNGGTDTYDIEEGTSVTIEFSPFDYQKVEAVTFNGTDVTNDLAAPYAGETRTYTFTMPSADATVNVTYRSIYNFINITSNGPGTTYYEAYGEPETLTDGQNGQAQINDGSDYSIVFVPNENCIILSVLVGDVDVTADLEDNPSGGNGKVLTLSNVREDKEVVVTYEADFNTLATTTTAGARYDFSQNASGFTGVSLLGRTITAGSQEMTFTAGDSPNIAASLSMDTYLYCPAGTTIQLKRSSSGSNLYFTKVQFTPFIGSSYPSVTVDGGDYDELTGTWTGQETSVTFVFVEDASIQMIETEAKVLFNVMFSSKGRGYTYFKGERIERTFDGTDYVANATYYMSPDESAVITFEPDERRHVEVATETRYDSNYNPTETDIVAQASTGSYTLSDLTGSTAINVTYRLQYPVVKFGAAGSGTIQLSAEYLNEQDESDSYQSDAINDLTNEIGLAYGAKLVFTLAPDDDCHLVSLEVNGNDVTAEVTNGTYTINSLTTGVTVSAIFAKDVAKPVINRNGRLFTISTETENATIFYYVDEGASPAINYQLYSPNEVHLLNAAGTIYAYAQLGDDNVSETVSLAVSMEDMTVTAPSNFAFADGKVTLTVPEGCEVHYTTDGSTPTVDSAVYPEGGITVTDNVTIKAISVRENWFNSEVAEYKVESFKYPYALFNEEGTELVFFYDGNKTASNGMEVGPFTVPDSRTWAQGAANITSVTFDSSFADYTELTSTAFWFYGFSALTNIEGIENLKTGNVTDMREMFHGCSNLTTLDVSHFNTANVERLDAMFQDCSGVTSLNLDNFNTAKVTNMRDMFDGCSSLTSLDLSSFETPELTSMLQMFYGCSSLTSVNMSKFNTSKVTTMMNLFNGCSSLTSIDIHHFVTSEVTNMQSMFYGCSSLTSLDITNFDTSKVTEMRSMFNGCSGLTSLDLTHFNTSEVLYMNFMFLGCTGLTSLDLSSFNTAKVLYMNYMFNDCSSLTTIFVSDLWSTASVTAGDYMFSGCTNLVGGNGTPYDANHVDQTYARIDKPNEPGYLTDKNAPEPYAVLSEGNTVLTFFYDNQKTAKGGMSVGSFSTESDRGWDNNREDITTVIFDESFANYTDLTSTAYWFYGFSNLTTFNNLEYLKTNNVMNMACMFNGCYNLTSLDLSGLKTENVIDMHGMFGGCSFLTNLNVSGFNTAKVTNMRDMFHGCFSLTTLNVGSFNTDNVTNMVGMFYGCSGLTSLDVSGFNTEKVTSMDDMFRNCSNLTSLDLSGFNTSNVITMPGMFYGCSALTTIYAGTDWTTANVTDSEDMFAGCTNLVGGYGTPFDANHTDKEYARIDKPNEPGYFTDKNALYPYALLSDNNKVLTFYFDNQKGINKGMGVGPFTYTSGSGVDSGWYEQRNNITSVVFDPSFANCTSLTSTAYWFYGCLNLATITNIENLKTDNVTDMSAMFYRCNSLTSLNVNSFNTENVTNMYFMFGYCFNLTSLDVSSFKTDNVTDMSHMFENCYGLTSLNMNGFKTENVTDMNSMFWGCSALTSLNVSDFNTGSVTNMNGMFEGCSGLKTLDLSSFNTNHVTDAGGMFENCYSLASIQLGNAKIPGSVLAEIENPNLLVYVNSADAAPDGIQNVVINGVAEEIVLTDMLQGNNNFYCPKAFTAHNISYTHDYTMHTEVGFSRGWETIALPFTVQTINHETNGALAPFGATGGKPFWLRRLTDTGLVNATTIEANVPYVISMPNNPDAYSPEYNQGGKVTFSAQDVTVPVTDPVVLVNGNIRMVPAFSRVETSALVYAINRNEARGTYAEGSVFEYNYRDVRPFEAYTLHIGTGPAPQYMPIGDWSGDIDSGITLVMSDAERTLQGCYTLDGRKLQDVPTTKGVYVINGKKRVIR